MSVKESELATSSTTEILHADQLKDNVYIKEGKETVIPVMSAAPISTPIASPAESIPPTVETSSKIESTQPNESTIEKVDPVNPEPTEVTQEIHEDTTMKDAEEEEDLDKDLFGSSDEIPVKPSEPVEQPSAKPLTPPVEEQHPASSSHETTSVKQEEPTPSAPAAVITEPPISTPPISSSLSEPPATTTSTETQKHSRPGTPADDTENPAKRLKSEGLSAVSTPVATKVSPVPRESTPKRQSSIPASDPRNPPAGSAQGLAKHQIKFALASLRAVKRLRDAGPFLAPVDIVKLNIPTYFDFVKNPMDLSTMERKVNAGQYTSVSDFASDMSLIVSNCSLFNGPDSEISNMARNIKTSFDKHMKNMPPYEQPPAAPSKPKRKSLPATSTPKSQRVAAAQAANSQLQMSTPKPAHLTQPQAPHSAPPKSSKVTPPAESKPFALQPSGIPTIRRDSSVDGRPKREIHPPRPKDLPYGDVKPRRKKFAAELKFCGTVLKELMSKKHESFSFPFLEPVDPVALNCPDYFKIIKEPMDLSTISKKYSTNQYENADDFESDVRLMFRNCYKFNPEGAPVNMMGHRLEVLFDKKWQEKPITPPTPPPPEHGDSSFDDDSEFDSDDNLELISNPAIKFLEEQLDHMQKELDKMKKDALRELRDRRRKQKQKKTGSKKPKSSEVNRRKSAPAGRHGSGNNAQNGPIQVTYEMKKELSEAIGTLSEKKMAHVLTVIQESMPQLRNTDQEEIELDMDTLDPNTLMKLYNYVVRKDEGKSRASQGSKSTMSGSGNASGAGMGGAVGSPGAGGAGGGSGPGGSSGGASSKNKKKSKPLSEAEQTRQIEQIQKKIEQFDRAENGVIGGAGAMSSDDDDDDDDGSGSSDDSSSEEE